MTDLHSNSTPCPLIRPDSHEIGFLDLLTVIAKYKKFFFGVVLAVSVLMGLLCLMMPNTYSGTVQLMPPLPQTSANAMLAQAGAMANSLGSGAFGGIKNVSDMYVDMLNSRTVADNLVQRFQLQSVYNASYPSDARKFLEKVTDISSKKDGVIAITVNDSNPQRAADLANGYVEELQKLTQTLAVTEASKQRMFLEKQLQEIRHNLSEAEFSLRQVQEKTGLIHLNGQSEALIRTETDLKAQIAAREVKLGAIGTFATTSNPDYIRTKQEIVGLRAQLAKVETGVNTDKGDLSVAGGKLPAVSLEYLRKARDVKYYETVYELLSRQLEVARLDEARESSPIQILDHAVVPERKSGPHRIIIMAITMFLAASFAACIVFSVDSFSLDSIMRSKENKSHAEKLALLKKYWRSR